MNIEKRREGPSLAVLLGGRLDTLTSPELLRSVETDLDGVTDLMLDMAGVEYVSSAGLRVILALHKKMAGQGRFSLRNVNAGVMEILSMTGFADILTIENAPGGVFA